MASPNGGGNWGAKAAGKASGSRNGAHVGTIGGGIGPLNAFRRASGTRFETDRVANVLPLSPTAFTLAQAAPGTPAADEGPVGSTPSPRRFGENQ